MNLTKFSPPGSHFGITIFQQEEDKRGIPLYLSYQVASPHIPSYPVVLCPLLSYPIISHHIKPQHIKPPSSLLEALENITIILIISMIGSCLVPSRFY